MRPFPGAVAQLGERVTGSHEVKGSIPFSSTNNKADITRKNGSSHGAARFVNRD